MVNAHMLSASASHLFLADLIATNARLLEVGLLDESVIGHMVCHNVTRFSGALIYLHEVIVMHEELTPTVFDTLRYEATTDYRPTLPTTDRPSVTRPHVPQQD